MNLMERTCRDIFPQDSEYRDLAKARLEQLTMPYWALGDIMDLGVDHGDFTSFAFRSMVSPIPCRKCLRIQADCVWS